MTFTANTTLERLEICCDYSLRNLCVHTDDVRWKLKKYCTHENIDNYPDGCIIYLKSFSVGCVTSEKVHTDHEGERIWKKEKKRFCSLFNTDYFHSLINVDHSNCAHLIYITLHCFRKQMTHVHQSK